MIALNPLLDLAYAGGQVKASAAGGMRPGDWQKRLYIFAGFDDYPIATLVRRRSGRKMGVGGAFFWQSVPATGVRNILHILDPPRVERA